MKAKRIWDNEPTPKTDKMNCYPEDSEHSTCVNAAFARNLEKRLRAAERLLQDDRQFEHGEKFNDWMAEVIAHQQAARQEDGDGI